MVLRARPYLHYAPVPGGVYFSGPGAQFVINGPELLYKVADVCVPLLEEGTTEDALVTALGSERARPVVRKIVADLAGHDLMLDQGRLTVPEPPAEERERHAEALAHLEAALDDPYAVFARLRSAVVLLCGAADAVLPAARGLHRAGITALTVATPDTDRVADTADRLGITVVPTAEGGRLPDPDAVPDRVDAVLCCPDVTRGDAAREELARFAAALPTGTLLVPVVGDGHLVVAGPAARAGAVDRAGALLRRAAARAAADPSDAPAPQPAAAVLGGALAGHLLFDALAGTGTPGAAHVVHGAELASEPVVTAAPGEPARPVALTDVHADADTEADAGTAAAAAPTPEEAVEAVTALSDRWTGLLTVTPGPELPQLPLALREATTEGEPGPLVAWAAEQRTATLAAALAALRRDRPAEHGVAAAGVSEEQWLLDGALRLLADTAEPCGTWSSATAAPETAPVLRALAEVGVTPPAVTLLRRPGLDWVLARPSAGDTDLPWNGASWGRDENEAAHGVLGSLLAAVQAAAAPGGPRVPDGVRTDVLLSADRAELALLRRQAVACALRDGVRHEGTPDREDPVLGTVPLWRGAVAATTHPAVEA
ncbi:hypothetical protein [Streptomyces bohaiensis]|uniref:hypothetical protein n=1 Tax=Streptomyces bohaiensis TaxID=1431344 RepID=UPI003B79A2E0